MKHIFICCLLGLGLCGCEKNQDSTSSDIFRISEVAIEDKESATRAAIWVDKFPAGTNIGVTLAKTATGEVVNSNSKWNFSGSTWNSSTTINLDANNYTAYAYYPYMDGITNLESVPVVYNQSDYMWGVSTSTSISSAPNKNLVAFNMQRAMTRVAVFIRKETTYKGEGKLTYLCLRNAPRKQVLFTDASQLRWNVKTGVLNHTGLPQAGSSLKMFTQDDEITYPVTLITAFVSQSVGDVIFAPVQSFQDGDIEIYLVVDGQEYIIPMPTPTNTGFTEANGGWKAGYNYRYGLTITPNHITLSAISINDWIEISDKPITVN